MKKRRVSGVTLALLVISLPIVAFNLMPVLLVKGALAADEYTLALWHFNEGEGQLVYDESIHNNDGTLGPTSNVEARDPSWTTGFTGQPGDYALSMDDWYDYVRVPDNPDDSLDLLCGDQFTIEFWTYVRQVSRADRGNGHQWNVFAFKRSGASGYVVTQCSYYPRLSSYFYDSTSTSHSLGCVPPSTYQWVHLMYTYDGQYVRIYFDYVLQNEMDIGHHYVLGSDSPLSIGKSLAGDEPWRDAVDCIIDEVRISSIARVPTIPATVNITPDTLNLKSNGEWITANITLPEGYNVEDINVTTVEMNHGDFVLAAEWGDIQNGALMVKFDRTTLRDYLGAADIDNGDKFYDITLKVTGVLLDDIQFEGSDTIAVMKK